MGGGGGEDKKWVEVSKRLTKERSNQQDTRGNEMTSLECGVDKNSKEDTDSSRNNAEMRMTAYRMIFGDAVGLT